MGRRKAKNKIKNWITSLVVFIILCVTGYYSTIYFQEDTQENRVEITSVESIENSELTDLNNNNLNIIFFYVGQADSTFINLKDFTMLIDAGNNEDGEKIANFLKEKGINKLDYIIATHADEDHIGGLDDIIKKIDTIGKMYIPTVGKSGIDYKNAIKAAKENNIIVENPVVGDTFSLGEANCEIMSAMEEEGVSDNDSSIVMQMKYKQTSYLFMGDAEKAVENSRSWNRVDVLKVGHHGSNSSSSEEFLEQVKPQYSIIEVGKDNSYNLPSSKAIERLENSGSKVLRTDMVSVGNVGSFWLTSDGTWINIKEVNMSLDGNS